MPYSNPWEPKTDLKASISECGIVTLVNVDGIKTITRPYNEMNQTKGPLANPAKDVDPSYLKGALRGDVGIIIREPGPICH